MYTCIYTYTHTNYSVNLKSSSSPSEVSNDVWRCKPGCGASAPFGLAPFSAFSNSAASIFWMLFARRACCACIRTYKKIKKRVLHIYIYM